MWVLLCHYNESKPDQIRSFEQRCVMREGVGGAGEGMELEMPVKGEEWEVPAKGWSGGAGEGTGVGGAGEGRGMGSAGDGEEPELVTKQDTKL
ncbi:hypothetical protein E2C01_047768 [Portunus trituberculatus]|uniref:Uncharacterized protein n=1 Tax=Portunus trituberculatus TaxID=210409 RepID=A0A5B7G8R8_PORTR|nr:hypothetical protein [Portunus trituberculatus]